MVGVTLLLSGRAMTLAFIGDAGSGNPAAAPHAWLMPLIGDAIIGVAALFVAYVIARGSGLWAWTTVIVWNAIGIWDALSAFVIHSTNPWPDFFMLKLFGPSMFFAASVMHALLIALACTAAVRGWLLYDTSNCST